MFTRMNGRSSHQKELVFKENMLYTEKERKAIRQREDAMVEFLLDELDIKVKEAKQEVLDVVFATAMAAKVKPKGIVDNLAPDKTRKFAEDLYDAIGERIKDLQQKALKDLKKSGIKAKVCAPCKKQDYRL